MPEVPITCRAVSLIAMRAIGNGHQVLLMRRTRGLSGEWCQVAGGIEDGETAWQAALRELFEETGLTPVKFYSADFCEQFYVADSNCIELLPVFVAVIDPQADVVLNDEHDAFEWLPFDRACELVSFGGQRQLLRHVEAEFAKRQPSSHLEIAL